MMPSVFSGIQFDLISFSLINSIAFSLEKTGIQELD
jgi:hypothetical protein